MKSRSDSAFFVLCRALLLSAILACTAFLMEVYFLGLLPVLESQLTNWDLWIVPAGIFGFVFFWCLSRNGLFHTFMVLLLAVSVGMTVYAQGPALSSHLVNLYLSRRIDLQRYSQIENPLYDNTYLLQTRPFPIYYVDDGNLEKTVSQDTLDALTQYIGQLPAGLLAGCTGIYLMEEGAFVQIDPQYEGSSVYGVSKSSDFTVHIRLSGEAGRYSYTYMHSGQPVTLDNPLFYTETIVHELVHLQDMQKAALGSLISDQPVIQAWFQQAPDLFGSYGATSTAEWFAEAGVYYYLYPEDLHALSPDIYFQMEALLPSRQ